MLQRLLPSSIQSVLRFFSSPQKPSIQKLPDEIFVDILFSYLELRDILNLREVCRWFYDLTHHEVVWKRLLQTSPLPIPPLPPLSRYKFDNLSAIEVQTLLVRAQSLERNWRKDGATPGVWSFDLEYRVEEVALLPGSKYLVASISDSTKRNWGIILCVLDSRLGVKPIAKTATKTKAFRLQARYFTINGTPGITIAFVCRDWVNAADRRKAYVASPNISEYSSQERIDSRYPIKHECRVLHVPLAPIEALDHSSIIPGSCQYLQKTRSMSPPFHQISLIRSRSQILGPLVLDDFGGEPYLTVVKDPSQIIFKPLEGGHVSIIDLLPNNEYPHLVRFVTTQNR
ncbi:hypothetical protein BDY19DRAFT_895289 [Irpex rosettiformis]|uniref:Uncharacterized protein n=1 Tax=Irpex rosettiformis TaxID=378272 RepID=A0ACB8TVW0_9APHY|nr:hypothetical protein BDY19DRAFT_895289 [Irpex rosettiformis]